MSTILLYIGVILTPYYELLLKVCPYIRSVSPDTRVAKQFLGMWLALAIGVSACFSGELRRCKNKWILLFLVYIPLSIHLSPKFNILLNGVDSTNFWVWKPFLFILAYFFMFMAVQSLRLSREKVKKLFEVMVWCGFIMSLYCIVQNYGWDQFFNPRSGDEFIYVTMPVTVGSLGNSTVVSPYIAMIIPFALYMRKIEITCPEFINDVRELHGIPTEEIFISIPRFIVVPIMVYAVWLCQSEMAIGAMVVSLLIYSCLRWRLRGILGVFLAVLLGLAIISWTRYLRPVDYKNWSAGIMQDNGRFNVWKDVARVIKDEQIGLEEKSRYPFTGTGLGSYTFIIRQLIENKHYKQVHNDYLELWATTGWAGFGLFMAALFYMLRYAFIGYLSFNQGELSALLSSFVCIGLVAGGTFIWQLAPHNFYSVLVAGLLSNRNLLKGELA